GTQSSQTDTCRRRAHRAVFTSLRDFVSSWREELISACSASSAFPLRDHRAVVGRGIGLTHFGSYFVSITSPPLITIRTFFVAAMFASGLPSITVKSASLPGSMLPRSLD